MNKFFRVLIPIILVIAIIACIGWYLFVYDRDFTRDMLLQGARFFEDQGNHTISNWFYDQAYEQANDNDSVAIELAEQHKMVGNYTKAEYTLTKAISDGGSAELYIALCKTYIEQDKILDAVKLLDAVLSENSSVDPAVKQELQRRRPAAPTCYPEAGFYSQYINATITAETGTLYVNAQGEYPSIADVPYSEPIALGDGENTLYALTISDEGLVSSLSIFGYTIGGVVKEVAFADAAMEEAMRLHLGVDNTEILFTNDLWDLTYFTVPEGVQDLSDLSYLTFVEDLAIHSAPSGQLNYLSSLVNVKSLQIHNTSVSAEEMKIIGALPKLERLSIVNCSLSTVSGLETAANLVYLDLSNNSIRDLTPLQNMTKLEEINLQHNAVNDLSALSVLSSVKKLNVSYNQLSTLNPIYSTTTLESLIAGNNQITSLAGIENLVALQTLDVSYNSLEDVSAVSACAAMKDLNVSSNLLADISALSALQNMELLNFSHNVVTSLPQFAQDCALVTIDGSHNQLSSLDALGGLYNLNNVFMDYNAGISSISPLTSCSLLIQVKVYGTQVSDVTALLSMDVLVEFDPTLAM